MSIRTISNIPNLASRLVTFFDPSKNERTSGPSSIQQFIQTKLGPNEQMYQHEIWPVCEQLCRLSVLLAAGCVPGSLPMTGACYWTSRVGNVDWWSHEAYRVFDNLVYGFPFIRSRFASSVWPVIVETRDNKPDIGTCFVMEDNFFTRAIFSVQQGQFIVTARHCVENMMSITIRGVDWGESKPRIDVHEDKEVDIACIWLANDTPLPSWEGFRWAHASVLDEVLVMGYPPIPGFNAIPIAEKAAVAGYERFEKATIGAVIAQEQPYFSNAHELMLISARVKGGNSGGPVINNAGLVTGVVTNSILDSEDRERVDWLGYGIATPINRLVEMYKDERREELPCQLIEGKIRTASIS